MAENDLPSGWLYTGTFFYFVALLGSVFYQGSLSAADTHKTIAAQLSICQKLADEEWNRDYRTDVDQFQIRCMRNAGYSLSAPCPFSARYKLDIARCYTVAGGSFRR